MPNVFFHTAVPYIFAVLKVAGLVRNNSGFPAKPLCQCTKIAIGSVT